MKKRKISTLILGMLLVVSTGNYARLTNGNVRTVEFISILAIGMIAGLMIHQVIALLKNEA